MDGFQKAFFNLTVIAALSVTLASPATAEEVMGKGNRFSVAGNYDSAGIDNSGYLNIDGNMNITGPFSNRVGGNINVSMGLNISGSTLTATNSGALTAASYWSNGHFNNNAGAVASLGVMKSSGNVRNAGTLSMLQESVVADFNGSGGTTNITVTKIDYFNNMNPLLSATGKIRLDSDSKIVINVSEDILTSTILDVVIAVSGDDLEFNNSSENRVFDRSHHFITSGSDFMKVTNIEMSVYGIRADFEVKRKK
ncbi:hypothetical protein [Endozoicomonas sp. 2B-B]